MATRKITELTNVTSVQDSDLLVVETSEGTRSVSKKELVSDINKYSYHDINLQNVAVTTASSNGAYYGTCAVLSEVMPDDYKNVVSLLNMGWTGESASFSLYVQDQVIKIISDVSQTIENLSIRIMYIQQ